MRLSLLSLALAAGTVVACATARPAEAPRASSLDAPERSARQVLAVMKPGPQRVWSEAARDLAGNLGLEVVSSWQIESLGAPCVVFEAPGARMTDRLLGRLAADPRVAAVQRNQTFETLGEEPHQDPYAHLQPGARTLRLEAAHRLATGRGVRIGLIDTGVDIGHPDLKSRIALAKSFLAEGDGTFTGDLHGTAVAGVLSAMADNGVGIFGAAPESELLALKACWPDGPGARRARCNTYTLARALDFALASGVQVLNLSLAGPPDELLSSLIRRALERGVTVVAARPPAGDPGFPAGVPGVIGVIGVDAPLPPATVASTGFLALAAPGVEVLTTVPRDSYDFFTGSSIAAAFVSGTVALLLEKSPGLSAARIRELLTGTARPLENPEGGLPLRLVDPCAALAALDPTARCD